MKTIHNIIYLLLSLAMFTGCVTNDDIMEDSCIASVEKSQQTQVMLSLAVPASKRPETSRSISINNDSEINKFVLWAFDGEGDNASFLYEVKDTDKDKAGNSIVKITESNGIKKMYVMLPESKNNITLVMIANASTSTPRESTTKLMALSSVNYSIDGSNVINFMPMYGESAPMTIEEGTKGSIQLRRAMAKIEIDAIHAYPQFEIKSVRLLNINYQGKVCGGVITDTPQKSMPYADLDVKNAEDNAISFYIPEVNNIDGSNGAPRVSVLIKGEYRGQGDTYYRLDFIGKTDLQEIKNIQRNYKYTFLIDHLTKSGYASEEEAIKGDASNGIGREIGITQTIEDEDIMDITTDNHFYFGVTKATLPADENDNYYFAKFSVKGNNPAGWKIVKEDLPDYVTTSMYEFIPAVTADIEKTNSVWVYINKSKLKELNKTFTSEDISIYSGNIRKKITISNE